MTGQARPVAELRHRGGRAPSRPPLQAASHQRAGSAVFLPHGQLWDGWWTVRGALAESRGGNGLQAPPRRMGKQSTVERLKEGRRCN